ncbi:Regulator of nonsense transcripts 1 [Glycine soja]|uniref:Regulator of nonsense transcripts 1 n=1 Tax=Glycine soja TaxID=3848 RepID=A0A0B2PMK2_GLYSO|nr:hypothetical protein JHK87_049026 [Glycine soja]KHN08757.1 Regulator of nonsense transcripts 1 [Glycine soja]
MAKFYLMSARLIFCTAASSTKLFTDGMTPVEFLVIDVKSQVSQEAEYGSSLFERLVSLGHKKHLLNVQYRMHPSISVFPNKEFYEKQISDALFVREMSYNRRSLEGKMYDSYSFINIAKGNTVGRTWPRLLLFARLLKALKMRVFQGQTKDTKVVTGEGWEYIEIAREQQYEL